MNYCIVEVKKSDKSLGIKKGEVYFGATYPYDSKCTLLARLPDGRDPQCNQYWSDVRILATHVVPSRTFIEDHPEVCWPTAA